MTWLADNFTPLWIVYFIVVAVVGIVVGVFISQHKPGQTMRQTIGASPFTLLGAFLFSTSLLAFLGFSSPTVVDWWQALAVRVAWQGGGIVVLEIGIVLDARYGGSLDEKPIWILMGVFFAIGAWMSFNPARDLVSGPIVMRGTSNLEVQKWARIRGGGGIEANIDLTAPDGTKETIDLAGWGANRAEDQFARCTPGSEVDVTVLRHVGTILDVACKER